MFHNSDFNLLVTELQKRTSVKTYEDSRQLYSHWGGVLPRLGGGGIARIPNDALQLTAQVPCGDERGETS